MEKKRRALLKTLALTIPLAAGLLYPVAFQLDIPQSIIIPTTGGGLMNLGFWLFYGSSVGAVPELKESFFGRDRGMFLAVSFLHLVAILILLTVDIRWVFGLF